uniref:Uncharacterized protein n=1 Tax=Hyaloperonospora arabidopsidis (strain Emoy2) TaxID=559515 RepID=M4BLJ1_HYAAE
MQNSALPVVQVRFFMQGTFASIFTFVFVLESNQPSVEMLVVGVAPVSGAEWSPSWEEDWG